MSGITALNSGSDITYFFKGDTYVKIKWTLESNSDRIDYGPTKFVETWKSLRASGFSYVDAILPIPRDPGQTAHRAYVFSGADFVQIEYSPGDAVFGHGAANISQNWKGLRDAKFERVDAAYIVPGTTDQAFIFRGDQYCRIKFSDTDRSDEANQLLEKPKPIQVFSSADLILQVKKVDAIVPVHGTNDEAYLFSGNQYFKFKVGANGDFELLKGPHWVVTFWKSLQQAGFY